MLGRIGSFFSLRDEDEEELYEEDEPLGPSRVIPLTKSGRRQGVEVGLFSPRGFQDVVEIADALRGKHVVIVNLQNADRSLLQRVVDFTSGVAYTIDGKIQKLAESIYLIVPAGVVVNAEGMRDAMMAGTLDFMGK
ncbi:MAG TPA: cell division protein SepF [Candidatus Tyrphobacter sp.]